MRTIHALYKYVLVLILMMIGAQQLQAQDAFYIYRNDGGFNGFSLTKLSAWAILRQTLRVKNMMFTSCRR